VSDRSQHGRSQISIYGLLLALFIVWGSTAFAQEGAMGGGGYEKEHRRAKDLIVACEGKTEGTPCSVSHRGHELNGFCHTSPHGELVCRTGRAATEERARRVWGTECRPVHPRLTQLHS
jgi:hypothetical protein